MESFDQGRAEKVCAVCKQLRGGHTQYIGFRNTARQFQCAIPIAGNRNGARFVCGNSAQRYYTGIRGRKSSIVGKWIVKLVNGGGVDRIGVGGLIVAILLQFGAACYIIRYERSSV